MPLTDTTTAARGVKRGMTQPSNSHYVGQIAATGVVISQRVGNRIIGLSVAFENFL